MSSCCDGSTSVAKCDFHTMFTTCCTLTLTADVSVITITHQEGNKWWIHSYTYAFGVYVKTQHLLHDKGERCSLSLISLLRFWCSRALQLTRPICSQDHQRLLAPQGIPWCDLYHFLTASWLTRTICICAKTCMMTFLTVLYEGHVKPCLSVGVRATICLSHISHLLWKFHKYVVIEAQRIQTLSSRNVKTGRKIRFLLSVCPFHFPCIGTFVDL